MESGTRSVITPKRTPALIGSIVLVLLACSSAVWAGSPPVAPSAGSDVAALEASLGDKAALGDLVAIAYKTNPMIRAARAEWQGVVEKYRVDTAWADPELMAEGMYPAEGLGDTAKPMDWKFSLAQAIPLWDVRVPPGR